jgi:hypothetical protein
MPHKIFRCAIAAIIISLMVPLYRFGQYETRATSIHLAGKIVAPLYKARMRVLSQGKNGPSTFYDFIITGQTRIIGTIKVGAEVDVTFVRRKRSNRSVRRVASVIKVLKEGGGGMQQVPQSVNPHYNKRSY